MYRLRLKELRIMLEECGDREQLIAALLSAYDLGDQVLTEFSAPPTGQQQVEQPTSLLLAFYS